MSRRFVAATEAALADLMAEDLSGPDLVALVIDGVHFADHLCVVALGIDIDGTKHPLGLVEGDTENATVVKDLFAGLRVRGMDTTRPILVMLDGAKALTTTGERCVRSSGDPAMPAPQDQRRRALPARSARRDRRHQDARRVPRPQPATGRSHAAGPAKDLDKTHPGAAGSR